MTRAIVIAAVRDFLLSVYTGSVTILDETGATVFDPPYAVVRIGTGEQMYPGQAEIWDMNVLVAVYHDADVTAAETAEANAAEVFAWLDDPMPLADSSEETLVWSAFERIGTDASVVESRWQHVAIFRAIVSPAGSGQGEPGGGNATLTYENGFATLTVGSVSVSFPAILNS